MITTNTIARAHSRSGGMALHYMTLYSLVLGVEAKNVFEFGGGFSSRVILEALEETGGKLISCDPQTDEELEMTSHPKWTHHQMKSNKALKMLKPDDMFELVFHDGSHRWDVLKKDIKGILPHIKRNGLIVVHDTIEYGKHYDLQKGLKIFKKERLTLPYGCGLTIIRNRKGKEDLNLKWEQER